MLGHFYKVNICRPEQCSLHKIEPAVGPNIHNILIEEYQSSKVQCSLGVGQSSTCVCELFVHVNLSMQLYNTCCEPGINLGKMPIGLNYTPILAPFTKRAPRWLLVMLSTPLPYQKYKQQFQDRKTTIIVQQTIDYALMCMHVKKRSTFSFALVSSQVCT